jgi:hypothetical protein
MHLGCYAAIQIIPVHADVEFAGGNSMAPNAFECRREPLGEGNPAGLDTNQYQFLTCFVALGDFVSDSDQCPLYRSRV